MKEKLKAYRLKQIRIQALEEKLERLIALAEKCTVSVGASGSQESSNDKLANHVIDMIEMQGMIQELLAEGIEELKECEEALKVLPENQRTVMELYFIHGMKWAEVAKTVGYTEEHCWRLQHFAFKKIKNMLGNVR